MAKLTLPFAILLDRSSTRWRRESERKGESDEGSRFDATRGQTGSQWCETGCTRWTCGLEQCFRPRQSYEHRQLYYWSSIIESDSTTRRPFFDFVLLKSAVHTKVIPSGKEIICDHRANIWSLCAQLWISQFLKITQFVRACVLYHKPFRDRTSMVQRDSTVPSRSHVCLK